MAGKIGRRVKAGWYAFSQVKDVLQQLTDKTLRKQLFESTVLPAMIYGSETWTMRKADQNKLQVTQRSMERIMLKVSRRDRIRNTEIRERTGITDIITFIRQRKLKWAGHVMRRKDNRWTTRATTWCLHYHTRPAGRPPPQRWRRWLPHYNNRTTGHGRWWETAQDPKAWRRVVNEAALEADAGI